MIPVKIDDICLEVDLKPMIIWQSLYEVEKI